MFTYDPLADAVYIYVAEPPIGAETHSSARTVAFGESRNVDYLRNGDVYGVEFLWVSYGIDLEGLPERDKLEQVLAAVRRLMDQIWEEPDATHDEDHPLL